jgi:hypothetical protein
LRDLDARWRDPRSPIRSWVPFVFLEFDAAEATETEPKPSIFVALDAPLHGLAAGPHVEAAREVAALLLDLAPDCSLVRRLDGYFAALPRSGVVLHIGAMLGRPERALRLSVSLSGADAAAYLRRLGAHDAANAAARIIEGFPSWLARAQIDFDLVPDIRPRIGFGVRPRDASRWPALLADLGAAGLAIPEKLSALAAWRGRSALHAGTASAPVGFERTLSHVKLVAAPTGPFEAKAYFGVEPAAS